MAITAQTAEGYGRARSATLGAGWAEPCPRYDSLSAYPRYNGESRPASTLGRLSAYSFVRFRAGLL